MARIIDIDERTAKKFVRRMVADIIVTVLMVMSFFLIPIGGESIVTLLINAIRRSGEIDEDAIKYGIALLSALLCVGYGVATLFRKKNKSSIGDGCETELPDSPFGQFAAEYAANNLLTGLFFIIAGCIFVFDVSITKALAFAAFFLLKSILFGRIYNIAGVQRTLTSLRLANEQQKKNSIAESTETEKIANEASGEEKKAETTISLQEQKNNLDALLKYKQLYDSGAITEEEYNKKREELLK